MSDRIDTKKQLDSFVKKATLIVLNSRVNKEILEVNIINNAFMLKEKENFDLEYLFLDEYCVLGMTNDNIKQYTIDIFARNKKTSLLIERWKFEYVE